MSTKSVRILAAIVVGLVLLLFVLRSTDDTGPIGTDRLLLPDLAATADDLERIRIERGEDADAITIRRGDSGWTVASRDDYPADIGLLRQLTIALSEARIVEEKTANPDNYGRLGVDDPATGGSGVRLSLAKADDDYVVIFGDTAQGDYRYARVEGDATSYLVDRNPEIPAAAGDWVDGKLLDIPADRIRSVTITHADGETITVDKDDVEQTDFTVRDIPEGRELSYQSVGNGIGGALGQLELDDVRAAVDGEAAATVVFETWDDATITAAVSRDGETDWVALTAEPDVDGLNSRVAGWQYRLPEFKNTLLVRRWPDLLKAEETPTDEAAGP